MVRDVIERASAEKGIARRSFDDEEIQRRALLAMVNEAASLISDSVALRPTDVDVVLANGYGFPRWEGGPVFWAREGGHEALVGDLEWLARCSGAGFVQGDVQHLLAEAD